METAKSIKTFKAEVMPSEEKSTDIRLINFSKYVKPSAEVQTSKEWVLNGKDNYFYQYLIDRYNGSATHSAILNSYIDLTYGQGLVNLNSNVADWLKFNAMLKEAEVKKVVADYVVFGEAILHIQKANNPKKIPKVTHLPKQNTAPFKANEKNEILGYFYSQNWKDVNKPENKPIPLPLMDESKSENCYAIKPYRVGMTYFCDPDYIGGVQYAEMEEEISNYYISHIRNGLSFGYIINIPDGNSYSPDEKNELEKKIKQRLVGSSNAGRFIINFNGRDAEITVTAIEVNDAHKQWEYLTGESRQQLMTAHRVTSPMLFGIKDNTGFGNNAEEMDTAEAQLMKRVIQPKQKYLLDAFQDIAEFWGLKLNLAFKPLTEPRVIDKTIDKNVSVTLSSDEKKKIELSDEELHTVLEMYALDPPDGYELCDESDYDLAMSDIQNSEQDSKRYKVRYAYTVGTSKTPKGESRGFCNKMIALSESGKVYRKEDIEKMSAQGVNGQFAHSGGKYDIFLYAGGVNCYHRWERRIYRKKLNDKGEPMGGNAMQNTDYVNVNQAIREGFTPPKNSPDVAMAEIDKPNKGAYPS